MAFCKHYRYAGPVVRKCLVPLLMVTLITMIVREVALNDKTPETPRNPKIDGVLLEQKHLLERHLEGYAFHSKLNVSNLKDLVLREGGQPLRNLIVTSWRSGSTFLGDILLSHPGTFYHYEPLLDFGIKQIRCGDEAAQAMHNLKHLLNCDYSEMEHYLKYGPSHPWVFSHNSVLWSRCKTFPDLCWKPEFLSPFCSLFPFQSLKTVRLRLNLTEELLEDKKLGVRLLLLVRDPRGTLQSRRHRDWCPGHKDCDDPETLCKDLVRDYITASVFRRKFPESFRAVRYEDVSFNVFNKTKELLDFFRLDFHPNIQKFLHTHTSRNKGGVSSTFRDSKAAPVHWQKDLSWEEVQRIQGVCGKALQLWGYEIAQSEEHLRSFMPVGPLEFF
ncbi:carbohydrate sulfotransferase 4-like [Penaeus indicus]|uniref:carbohydrate sulfotransferase 4-like n=1 Tax=Penaeus indicus TaxID=29960 RepID=UPI00300C222E